MKSAAIQKEEQPCRRCERTRYCAGNGLCTSCNSMFYQRCASHGKMGVDAFITRFPSRCVKRVLQSAQVIRIRPTVVQTQLPPLELIPGFICASPAMRRIAELIRRLANTDNVVLITGETGTGKELVAKALHELHSKRKQHSIVVVDCARLSIGTAQSELFGHVKGAFTGAVTSTRGLIGRADRGTLFLDEVSCLPLEAQAILLRLLEERDYRAVGAAAYQSSDFRVVAATNEPLSRLVEEGRFRADLYQRLAVFPLCLPPLRQRPEDILHLVTYFLRQLERPEVELAAGTIECLQKYDWPGNVRELITVLRRTLFLMESDDALTADAVTDGLRWTDSAEL